MTLQQFLRQQVMLMISSGFPWPLCGNMKVRLPGSTATSDRHVVLLKHAKCAGLVVNAARIAEEAAERFELCK